MIRSLRHDDAADVGADISVLAFLEDTDDLEGARIVRIAAPGVRDEALVMLEGEDQHG